MLHDNMDIFRLMFHAQQVEDSYLRNRRREDKKATSLESGFSMSRLDFQDQPNFKKKFANTVPCNSPRITKIEVLILNLKR